MSNLKNYLTLSHLSVKNANAQSSPITVGIPALTAFFGAMHKLQRELHSRGFSDIKILGTGIIIHDAYLHVYKTGRNKDSLILSSNPLVKKGSTFERPSTIPDAKIDFTASLICEVEDNSFDLDVDEFRAAIDAILQNSLKIAGGDILPPCDNDGKTISSFTRQIKYYPGVDCDNYTEIKQITNRLVPGFALIERRDLMIEAMQQGNTAIDSLIDFLAIHNECNKTEEGDVQWKTFKRTNGWLVPISVGFQRLTPPQQVQNQRDENYPHIFVENLITLGEYRMINSFKNLDEIMWKYIFDESKSQYKCTCMCKGE